MLGDQFHQYTRLHRLDIGKIVFPAEMGIHDDKAIPSRAGFEETEDGDGVLRHDAVEDIVGRLHVGSVDGCLSKVDQLLVQ